MKMTVRSLMVGICVGLVMIGLSSCNTEPSTLGELQRWNEEVAQIDADLASQQLPVLKDPSGIRIVISGLGTDLPAQPWNTVDVDYVGKRYNDKFVFDQGHTKEKLSEYIRGWQVALSKLPAGSQGKLIIPSFYGYGPGGYGEKIPGNTILEFDISFNEVEPSASEIQRFKTDTTAIDAYLTEKGITAIEDPTGLRYVINTPGVGYSPSWFDRVKLKYTIKLLSDDTRTIATIEREPTDDFYSRPIDYIHGMKIGLKKLSSGSKAVFYIPSGYAFGPETVSDGTGNSVPANSNIIVEVELTEVL